MTKLSEPSPKLAERLLREVGFEERFLGVKMSPRAGNQVFSMYGFKEIVDFLRLDRSENLLVKGSGSSVGYLDLNQLTVWVREIFGDTELAREMEKETAKTDSYINKAKTIRQLMKRRLNQCNEMVRNRKSSGPGSLS